MGFGFYEDPVHVILKKNSIHLPVKLSGMNNSWYIADASRVCIVIRNIRKLLDKVDVRSTWFLIIFGIPLLLLMLIFRVNLFSDKIPLKKRQVQKKSSLPQETSPF